MRAEHLPMRAERLPTGFAVLPMRVE